MTIRYHHYSIGQHDRCSSLYKIGIMGAYVGKPEIVEIGLNAGAEINTSEMGFYNGS